MTEIRAAAVAALAVPFPAPRPLAAMAFAVVLTLPLATAADAQPPNRGGDREANISLAVEYIRSWASQCGIDTRVSLSSSGLLDVVQDVHYVEWTRRYGQAFEETFALATDAGRLAFKATLAGLSPDVTVVRRPRATDIASYTRLPDGKFPSHFVGIQCVLAECISIVENSEPPGVYRYNNRNDPHDAFGRLLETDRDRAPYPRFVTNNSYSFVLCASDEVAERFGRALAYLIRESGGQDLPF